MNRLSLVAAVAVIAIGLVGGAVLLSSGRPGPALPTPAPTAGATASPTVLDAVAPLPAATLGNWVADAAPIQGVSQKAQRIQLSFNWDGGLTAWVQLDGEDRLVVQSSSLAAPSGELRLRADVGNTGCAFGDDGRYRWRRSADGFLLTLELIQDACAARSAAIARTWVHSLGVVNDGGRGVNIGLTPAYEVTLPKVHLAMGGPDQATVIHTCASDGCGSGGAFDPEPGFSFVTIKDPIGWADPCEVTGPQTVPIAQTTAAFVAYMKTIPGLSVITKQTQVDVYPAVRLDITSDAGIACPRGEIHLFRSSRPPENNGGDYGLKLGDATAMWIVDLGTGDTVLFWYSGDGVTAADQQAAIDSIRFLYSMPTS